MSEALKAFEEELQRRISKATGRTCRVMLTASPCRLSNLASGKGRTFSPRWKKPAKSSDWTCRFVA